MPPRVNIRELSLHGWVGAGSVEKVEIGKLKIARNKAKGEFIVSGQVTPLSLLFNRTELGWRLNLVSRLMFSELPMKELAKKTGQDENEFLVALIQQVSGKSVSETIWEPLEVPAKSPQPQP